MAWGGAAYDPAHRMLLIPTNNLGAEGKADSQGGFSLCERETEGRNVAGDWEFAEQRGTPYGDGSAAVACAGSGLPCIAPPWGVLNGVDADTGEVKWTTPTGTFGAGGPAGSISLGGPIATAGGLVFMGGTLDSAIYAYVVETGKQLWRGELPTSARSTPMTFRGPDGRQFVVIAAGGHGVKGMGALGDYLVAFALGSER